MTSNYKRAIVSEKRLESKCVLANLSEPRPTTLLRKGPALTTISRSAQCQESRRRELAHPIPPGSTAIFIYPLVQTARPESSAIFLASQFSKEADTERVLAFVGSIGDADSHQVEPLVNALRNFRGNAEVKPGYSALTRDGSSWNAMSSSEDFCPHLSRRGQDANLLRREFWEAIREPQSK